MDKYSIEGGKPINIYKHALRIMRITLFLLFFGILFSQASISYSQGAEIALALKSTSIKKICEKIENSSDFRFIFAGNAKTIINKQVDIAINSPDIEEILNTMLSNTELSYKILDNQIVVYLDDDKITSPAIEEITSVLNIQQQKRQITGVITDKEGESIIGANIVEKGTTNGTITDIDGHFSLNIENNATIQISFIGYLPQEVNTTGKTSLDIVMLEDTKALEELVVVGYGVQQKASLTAAVGTIGGKDLENVPVANVSQTLGGRVPGLITAQNSGEVGNDQVSMNIRGIGTYGNSAPLIIIDGVVSQTSSFNRLDANNIQSVTILKDAAAVAPYGMAGANGVLIVTSKKGNVGRPKLSYNGYYGLQNPTVITELLNSYDYARMRNIAVYNQDPTATLPFTEEQVQGYKKTVDGAPDADHDAYPNTNAIDEIINRNTPISQHHLSLSGGSEFVNYFVGIGFQYQEGLWSSVNNQRYNLHSSIEMKPTNTTTIGLNLKGYNQIIEQPSASGTSIFTNAQAYLPIHAIKYSNGLPGHSQGVNIMDRLTSGNRKSDSFNTMVQFSIEQKLPFIEGLKVKGIIDFNFDKQFNKNWSEPELTYYNINTSTNPYTYTPVESTGKPSLSESIRNYRARVFQGMLNYDRTFDKHSISFLAVMESRITNNHSMGASRSNYNIDIPELSLGSPDQTYWGNSGNTSESSQVGYVYRLGYQFDNKYLFEATGRYDGHYYFAPGKKYGFFPAFSLGWRIDQEKFFSQSNISWIDLLKIRASWGQSGNLAGGPFQYSSGMTVYSNAYVFDGQIMQGVYETIEPNTNITWERAEKYNLGFESALWNRLLSLEIDFFYEHRGNMLITPDALIPAEYGIEIAQTNEGEMENKGIDFMLGSRYTLKNGLSFNTSLNFTYAKNKILEIAENPVTRNDPNRSRTGRALNTPFGLKADRLYQEDDFLPDGSLKPGYSISTFGDVAPGDIKWVDIDGDGYITASDETALGYPRLPQIIYGLNLGVSYKGFDLSTLFQGSAQSNVFIQSQLAYPFLIAANAPTAAKDYWTPENTNATYPRLVGDGGSSNNRAQRYGNDFFKRNGDYLRLKNIQLSYNLPDRFIKRYVQSVRLIISGQNLLTFSETSKLFDPEMNQGGADDNNERGWYHPQLKTVTFGVNINF